MACAGAPLPLPLPLLLLLPPAQLGDIYRSIIPPTRRMS